MMMIVESRKSKLAKRWGRAALAEYATLMDMEFAETPEEGESFRKLAAFDAQLLERKAYGLEIASILEIKARWFNEETLAQWGNEWMISKSKLEDCSTVARLTRVPFYGMVVSVSLRSFWVIQLADIDGQPAVPMRFAETETQRSTEGGTKTETLAYIDLKYAAKHKMKTKAQ